MKKNKKYIDYFFLFRYHKISQKMAIKGGGEMSQEIKENINSMFTDEKNVSALIDEYINQRKEINQLESELKEKKIQLAIQETELISQMLENQIDSVKRADGVNVNHREISYPRVLKADREKQIEWLEKIGHGSLIEPSVNSQTFAAFIRKEWDGEIPDFVKIDKTRKIFIRGLK